MAIQTPVSFSAVPAAGERTIIVDENEKYQQITGFGAAFTDSAVYLLNQVATPAEREAAMTRLFTRAGTGIGLSAMRTIMGSSDISPVHYSYDDLPPGQTDPDLKSFSIDHDRVDMIPIMFQAKQLNPQMRLLSSIWSPPGWMKTSDSLIGGALLPSAYAPYANYFVRYLQAYNDVGITINAVSRQNEPNFSPSDYPGMVTDAPTETLLLRDYILPAFQANNLTATVLVYDHNWDDVEFPTTVLSDPVLAKSDQILGTAWHAYAGTPGAMTTLHNRFPNRANYETEASGGLWVVDQVETDFLTITHTLRNWGRTFLKWSLALDENHGPHLGGCATCTPIILVDTRTGAVTNTIEYYTIGHFSKYVVPDAVRIYSSNATGVVSAAFANPDGSKALVAFNSTSSDNTFQVSWGTQSFTYTLPKLSAATFTWGGAQCGTYSIAATSRIQASSYNDVFELQTEATADMNGGYDLGFSEEGSYAIYRNVAFGPGLTGIDARVASAGNGGTVEFHLDSVSGPMVGSIRVPMTGGWQSWQTVSGTASGSFGVHDLYVVFKGPGPIGNVNWFQFR